MKRLALTLIAVTALIDAIAGGKRRSAASKGYASRPT